MTSRLSQSDRQQDFYRFADIQGTNIGMNFASSISMRRYVGVAVGAVYLFVWTSPRVYMSAYRVVFIVRCLPMFCSLIYDFTKSVLVEIVSGIVLDGCWCFKMVLLFLSVDVYYLYTSVVRVPGPVVPCIICCCRLSFVEPT